MMVLIMENAALNAIREYLDPGESAVGTKVDVTHTAATPVGHRVRAEAEVVGVTGRQIQFRVAAWDEAEQIGAGTHERMVVDLERIGKRLAGKAARLIEQSVAAEAHPRPRRRPRVWQTEANRGPVTPFARPEASASAERSDSRERGRPARGAEAEVHGRDLRHRGSVAGVDRRRDERQARRFGRGNAGDGTIETVGHASETLTGRNRCAAASRRVRRNTGLHLRWRASVALPVAPSRVSDPGYGPTVRPRACGAHRPPRRTREQRTLREWRPARFHSPDTDIRFAKRTAVRPTFSPESCGFVRGRDRHAPANGAPARERTTLPPAPCAVSRPRHDHETG
ncbi:thioesterase family protein [Methylobacterium oryzae CBMB20]